MLRNTHTHTIPIKDSEVASERIIEAAMKAVLVEEALANELRLAYVRAVVVLISTLLDVLVFFFPEPLIGKSSVPPTIALFSTAASFVSVGLVWFLRSRRADAWLSRLQVGIPLFDGVLLGSFITNIHPILGTTQPMILANITAFCCLLAVSGGMRLRQRSVTLTYTVALVNFGYASVLFDLDIAIALFAAFTILGTGFVARWMADIVQRTAQLAQANQKITLLNERLRSENVRMSAELAVTRRIQQMILPKDQELSQIDDLEISGYMAPADEVGGDYYDVLHHNGSVKIGMGDVTGHGLESGMLMLMVQTAVRTLLETQENDTSRFLDTLNRVIYQNAQRMNSDRTLSLVLLDYVEGKLRLSGQHEEVLLVRADGTVESINTLNLGFPVGLVEEIAGFVAHLHIDLAPGDGVVLYTDGITEAINLSKELYGLERLCQVISQNWQRSCPEIRQAAIDDLRAHIGDQRVFDDITLLIVKQRAK